MRGRSGVLLALAVACGLGAMYGANKLLSKGSKDVEEVSVLVAVRDLPIEDVLKPDAVRVARLPRASVPAGALTDPKQVEDRWVMIKMLEGEPIVEAKLAPKGSPSGLVARIPKGMRALAIEVNESTGVSGFVLPGHRIDIIQTRPDGGARKNRGLTGEADTILENVLVLASGQILTRPEDKSVNVRTVTLAVTPEEADLLVAARQKGPLSLSLRGLNDTAARPKPKPDEPEGDPVVVARRDLRPQELIDATLLEVKPFPKGLAPARGFKSIAEAEGRRVRQPIFAGEPLLEAKVTAKGAPIEPEGVPVVVAKRDLMPKDEIDAESIEVKRFPKDLAPSRGFADPGQVDGRYVRAPIHAGEPVLDTRILPRGTRPEELVGVHKLLGKGMRAFVLTGDAKAGFGPHIKSENRVDVLYTEKTTTATYSGSNMAMGQVNLGLNPILGLTDPGVGQNAGAMAGAYATKQSAKAEILLENIRVLAGPGDSKEGTGKLDNNYVVTVEVPVDATDDLAAAQTSGTISLVLRGEGDNSRAATLAAQAPEFFYIHKGLLEPEQVRMRPRQRRFGVNADEEDEAPRTPPTARPAAGVHVRRGSAP